MAFGAIRSRGRRRRLATQELAGVGVTFDPSNPAHQTVARADTRAQVRRLITAHGLGTATLPSSAFAGYAPDPATRSTLCLGACSLNGSSQYGWTSTLSTTAEDLAAGSALPAELGGATVGAVVVFARFVRSANAAARTVWGFGDSSGSAPYARLVLDASHNLEVERSASGLDTTTAIATATAGAITAAVRFNADNTLDVATLAADGRTVVWVNDTTTKALAGLDRFAIGALVRSTVADYHDDAVAEVGIGVSDTSKAAMAAYCLGASLSQVGANSGWDLSEASEFTATLGSVNLTNAGSVSFADASAPVFANRDVTADPSHANYQADVVGGAVSDGTKTAYTDSWVEPNGDFYLALYYTPAAATPSADVYLWMSSDGTFGERRTVRHLSSGFLQVTDGSAGPVISTSGFGDGEPLLIVAKFEADGGSRSIWVGPVGGSLSTQTNATDVTPATHTSMTFGARDDSRTSSRWESGSIVTKARFFLASDVSDEDKFVRSLHRNWSQNVPTPVHAYDFNGDANDSAGSINLTWTGSYSTALVVSSHYHRLPPAGVTWNATEGAPDYDGSTGYDRVASAFDVDTPLIVTARVTPDTVAAGIDTIFGASDGTDNERIQLYRSADDFVVQVRDGGVADTSTAADGLSADTAATVQGELASTTSRTASIDGVAGTENTDSNAPSGIDRWVFGRSSKATPGDYWDGTMGRAALTADTADNADARTWTESAA